MDNLVIEDLKIVPCENSKYVQPSRLEFTQVLKDVKLTGMFLSSIDDKI